MVAPARFPRAAARGASPGKGARRGFSLLEVLVAFVILALVATALFRLFGGALSNASAAEEWSRAVMIAQSQLVAAASAQPLKEGTDSGSDADGRIRWESRVAVYTPPDLTPEMQRTQETLPNQLYRVEVDVRFPGTAGGERTVSLFTLRMVAKELR
jgi:general secretion pathway protein I